MIIDIDNKKEIKNIVNIFKKISAVILFLVGVLILVSFLKFAFTITLLITGFGLGAFLSVVNIAAIGFYIYKSFFNNGPKSIIFYPIASFLTMCLTAFLLYKNFWLILGFGIGLTTPLLVAILVVILLKKK